MTEPGVQLFAWPQRAEFARKLNKERFYAGVSSNRKLKRLFTEQVTRVTWQYKLASLSLNLPATNGVPEIEVIQIDAVTDQLDPAVLLAIDRAIPNPTILEIHAGGQVRQTAAYKRSSESDKKLIVIGHYVTSDWVAADHPRATLPITLNLGSLYAAILRSMMDVPLRDGERLRDHVERHSEILTARREAERIEKKMNAEKQLNRKVEWNAQLRTINQKIALLTQETSQEADA